MKRRKLLSISPSFSSRSRSAFSLLEVMIALGILAMLAGSIYGVLKGVIQMTAAMEETRIRQQQVEGMLELCRKTFRTIPADAIWEGRIRNQDGKIFPEIIIRRAPEQLAWERVSDFNAVSVLGQRPQVGGLFSLSLLRVSRPEGSLKDPVAGCLPADWLPLVTDLKKLEWRYFDAQQDKWFDEIPSGGMRPAAIELSLWVPGEKDPVVAVFWVVPLTASPNLVSVKGPTP